MKQNPTLSIVMAAYNNAKTIADSIESVLSQTFADFELLIINDGSTDETAEIVARFTDTRIVFAENLKNSGIVFTKNKGFEMARGKFVAVLDADDIVLPQKFEKQLRYFESHPQIGVLGTNVEIIDENGKRTGEKWTLKAPWQAIPSILLFNNYMVNSSIMLRKSILDEMQYRKAFEFTEDYDLLSRIAKQNNIAILPEYLLHYRLHSNNASLKNRAKQIEIIKKIQHGLLHDLEIEASVEDVELHYSIANSTFLPSKDFLYAGRAWLKLLFQQNQKLTKYNSKHFNFVLLRMWFKILAKSFKAVPLHVLLFSIHPPFLAKFKSFAY